MEMQITGKNFEISAATRTYIQKKFDKIGRHLTNILSFEVEITEESTRSPQQRFVVQVTINNNGVLLRGQERAQDLYSAVDRVSQVMDRQVEHYKSKLMSKEKHGASVRFHNVRDKTMAAPVETVVTEPPLPEPKVVKTKKFDVKPMSVEEALDQMELLGHDFFLFYNPDAQGLNLVYKRNDGNYGLIEPVVK
jgi:putative sigma-54 modulation protein